MNFEIKYWWFGLRGCLFCGSLHPGSDGLCTVCSGELWIWADPEDLYHQEVHKLPVASLFQWIPGKQQVLSYLVMALKGEGGQHLWKIYADEFLRRHLLSSEPLKKELIFIPSPAKKRAVDHALLFTNGLSEASGAQVYNCLSRTSVSRAQKTRTRAQRQRVTFGWAENFSAEEVADAIEGKQVVFIDDVVTTGATAAAAWRTLGKPKDFTIWSLAQRSLSCGASMDLV